MKLCTKYQRPGYSVFRYDDFEGFLYISLCKTSWTRGRAIFGPRAMNNLGRGPLGEAIYQISKA